MIPSFITPKILWFAEESWNGSGSGSGDDDEDDPTTDDEDGFGESEGEGSGEEASGPIPESPKEPKVVQVPDEHSGTSPPRVDIEPKVSTGHENETNSIEGSSDDSRADNGVSSGNSDKRKMSLQRALATYLLPIAVMWVGGSLTEWLWLPEDSFDLVPRL